MTQITAPSSLGNVLSSQIKVDMDKVWHLEPSSDPLTMLMNKTSQTRQVTNPRFDILNQELQAVRTQVNNGAGYNSAATAITMDDASYFSAGDVLEVVRTGEHILVTTAHATAPTVVRGVGEVAAAAMLDDDYILKVGNAYTEGSDVGTPNSRQLTTAYNYCQVLRLPFGVTNTANETEMYSGNELKRLTAEAAIEFSILAERMNIFGQRGILNSSGDNPRRFSRGFLKFCTTNTYDASGALSESNFNSNWLAGLFRFGSDTKLLLASSELITAMDYWGRSKLQINEQMSTKLGVVVKEYLSGHGRLLVVKHKLLENDYAGYGLGVDLKFVRQVIFRKAKLLTNRQGPGVDGRIDEYLAEIGFEMMQPKTCGYIYGVTGGA